MGFVSIALIALPSATSAATYSATPSTLAAIWKKAVGGDTINLSGTFGLTRLFNKTSTRPILINASRATFTDSLLFDRVTGVRLSGGRFGSKTNTMSYGTGINFKLSNNITVDGATVVGAPGANKGVNVQGGQNITISNGIFTGLKVGVAFSGVTNGSINNNRSVASTSDGFVIVDSHKVNVSRNSCSGGVPGAGAHPDCIQLYSLPGRPVQSDIDVNFNSATGPTQGFSSFTPAWGGGLRLTFRNNTADITFAHGIACYGCVDSTIINNTLKSSGGPSAWTRITVSGGSNNRVENNSIGARPSGKPRSATELAVMSSLDMEAGSSFTDATSIRSAGSTDGSFGPAANAAGAIPEPSTWAMMILGFGLVGVLTRRQRGSRVLAA